MLDKKTEKLLKLLGKLLGDENYKVLTAEEIISALPKTMNFDADGIKETIDFLAKHEYLSLKFEEEQTICYTLLPKARIIIEQTEMDKKVMEPKTTAKIPFYWLLLMFLVSLLGTFSACVLYYFIFIK